MSESAFSAYCKSMPKSAKESPKSTKESPKKSKRPPSAKNAAKRKFDKTNGNGTKSSATKKSSPKKSKVIAPKRKSFATEVHCPTSESDSSDASNASPHQHTAPGAGKQHASPQQSTTNSIDDGKRMLAWILSGISPDDFMRDHWEKKPLLIKRKSPDYYQSLLSTAAIDRMLREQRVEFTKNLDVTSYRNGVRETHNPDGRAMAPVVWDFYQDGCSLRMLNPQTFIGKIHQMNATLQEYFQCMTGANFYLTPPNSQGFAPHYDDIEAFILQVEGRKRWKLYRPRSVAEYLPSESSANFSDSDIGEPILETLLEAGDCMYFPRGTIHQATTVADQHSLHITLSMYQRQTWGDLLEIMVPMALKKAIADNVKLRAGLPVNIWQRMGIANQGDDDALSSAASANQRKAIKDTIQKMFMSIMAHLPIDEAVDRMAIRYQHDALPPVLTAAEKARSVSGTAAAIDGDSGTVMVAEMTTDTEIRLIRANILRLVRHSDDELRVYFYADNSREYHEFEQKYMEIDGNNASTIERLIRVYPEYVRVADLETIDEVNGESADEDSDADSALQALQLAQCLWDRGLLMTKDVMKC